MVSVPSKQTKFNKLFCVHILLFTSKCADLEKKKYRSDLLTFPLFKN